MLEEEIGDISSSRLIDLLTLQNPWWKGKDKFPKLKTFKFKRRDFYQIMNKEIPLKEVCLIVGPRRVGKSTLLFDVIEELLKSKDPKTIMYFPAEDSVFRHATLLDALNVFARSQLELNNLRELKNQVFVFVDEIQELEKWATQIKEIWDLGLPIKFIISGSSSIKILKEVSTLAGRVRLSKVFPLKFSETVRYQLVMKNQEDFVTEVKLNLRAGLKDSITKKDYRPFYKELEIAYSDLSQQQALVEDAWKLYTIKGGYPELLDVSDFNEASAKLTSTILLKLDNDLKPASIDATDKIRDLLEYMACMSSCLTNYSALSKVLGGISDPTVKKYVKYLIMAMLCSKSRIYAKSMKTSLRKQKFKLYVLDPGLRNMLCGYLNKYLWRNKTELAKVVETVVYDHSIRFLFNIRKPNASVSFWHSKKDYEVDVVLDYLNKIIPVEVKLYSPKEEKLKGINEFMTRFKSPFGIVITGSELAFRNRKIFVPIWLYLLMC